MKTVSARLKEIYIAKSRWVGCSVFVGNSTRLGRFGLTSENLHRSFSLTKALDNG